MLTPREGVVRDAGYGIHTPSTVFVHHGFRVWQQGTPSVLHTLHSSCDDDEVRRILFSSVRSRDEVLV